jgi:hypothetical protein
VEHGNTGAKQNLIQTTGLAFKNRRENEEGCVTSKASRLTGSLRRCVLTDTTPSVAECWPSVDESKSGYLEVSKPAALFRFRYQCDCTTLACQRNKQGVPDFGCSGCARTAGSSHQRQSTMQLPVSKNRRCPFQLPTTLDCGLNCSGPGGLGYEPCQYGYSQSMSRIGSR